MNVITIMVLQMVPVATCQLCHNCCLQVHLQTQQKGEASITQNVINIVRHQGVLALNNGLSGALLRQLSYSTIRFAVYEVSAR